jgi:hypothetical protein
MEGSPHPQPLPRKRGRGAQLDEDASVSLSRTAGEGQGGGLPIVVAQDDVDELHIIERWLHHHAQEPGQFPLPEARDAAAGWWALAEALVSYDAAAEDWTKADLDAALAEEDDAPVTTDE